MPVSNWTHRRSAGIRGTKSNQLKQKFTFKASVNRRNQIELIGEVSGFVSQCEKFSLKILQQQIPIRKQQCTGNLELQTRIEMYEFRAIFTKIAQKAAHWFVRVFEKS